MARCRIGYLLALLGAGAFFLFFNGYFSFYILVLALVFPLFSFLLSLPGMLAVRADLTAPSPSVRRGEGAVFALTAANRRRLPVGRLTARMVCTNLMTGQTVRFHRKGPGSSAGLILRAELAEKHCGLLRCEVTRLKVCDLLGLFALPLPRPEAAEVLSFPLELPTEDVPLLLGEEKGALTLTPRPGGGPGEDYDLRPYRPGDPMRSVHWKLSSKADKLMVREVLEPARVQIVLTYDHFGPMEHLDRVLDRLDAISRGLIARERSHAVRWADLVTGEILNHSISSLKDLRAFEHTALSTPVPPSGLSILDRQGLAGGARLRHLHVTPQEKEGEEG